MILHLNISAGDGFCNYERFESPDNSGIYYWNETTIGDQELPCVYGDQTPSITMGRAVATRRCDSNLNWRGYNGLQCASEALSILRAAVEVSRC